MQVIPFSEFLNQQEFFVGEAKAGKIFVYPTDTIYGIGGIITQQVVEKVTQIKQRKQGKHYSIIAPSSDRVEKFFEVSNFKAYRDTNKQALSVRRGLTILCPLRFTYQKIIGIVSSNTLVGIRFLDHPIQQFVTQLGEGFISTSANISGQPPIQSLHDLHPSQIEQIDYAIDAGTIDGKPSRIIDYKSGQVIRR